MQFYRWAKNPTQSLMVLSFTEALISEMKDTNITITALQPGATKQSEPVNERK